MKEIGTSKQFTHLLLTRFNAAIDFAPSAKRLDTDWLAGRLALFEQYCLPSVAAQQSAEFHWLVFFDAASPAWFKERIAAFEPLFKPIYIDGLATDEVIASRVAQTGIVSTPYLITTRLDNDDAISENHLALVQGAFQNQHREFLTFPFGLQSFRGQLYNVYWLCNPFLSLVEKVGGKGEFTTVFCVAHDRVGAANKLRKVFCPSQWLQVLHDSNLANTLRGWPRIRNRPPLNFNVFWSENSGAGSIVSRFRFSARAYIKRAGDKVKANARRKMQKNSIPLGSPGA